MKNFEIPESDGFSLIQSYMISLFGIFVHQTCYIYGLSLEGIGANIEGRERSWNPIVLLKSFEMNTKHDYICIIPVEEHPRFLPLEQSPEATRCGNDASPPLPPAAIDLLLGRTHAID